MIFNKNDLYDEVNNFSFRTKSNELFWAPYQRNDDHKENPNAPRGLGKSSWQDIKRSIEYIESTYPNLSGEQIRIKLIDGSLEKLDMNYKAVDCSGFVYYVMNSIYTNNFGYELSEILSIDKVNVLNGADNFIEWRKKHILSSKERDSLPENVPIRWVCDTFGRKAVNLCNVSGFTSKFSSRPLDPSQLKPGDLVRMSTEGSNIPHIAVILEASNSSIIMSHSERTNNQDIGGVIIEEVRIDTGKNLYCKNSTRILEGFYRLKLK